MKQKVYFISEAAKEIGVENHVLRYWEEELRLPIKRNDMGHRFYTKEDIERFQQIKLLKDNGLQLKAVHKVLKGEQAVSKSKTSEIKKTTVPAVQERMQIGEPVREQRLERMQELLQGMIDQAVERSNRLMTDELKEFLAKEMDYQFRMSDEKQDENWRKEEAYFKDLDALIRKKQKKLNKDPKTDEKRREEIVEKHNKFRIFTRKEVQV